MKNSILCLTVAFATWIMINQAFSQNSPIFRQNQFNVLLLNPAHAGGNNYSDVSVTAASMFSGVQGAPKAVVGSGNFKIDGNLGIGVNIVAQQMGPVRQFQNALSLAYHLKLNSNWRLTVGLRGNVGSTRVDLPSLVSTQEDDPHLQSSISTGIKLRAGYGFLLYSPKYYFGFAQPNIGKTVYVANNISNLVQNKVTLNSYAGCILDMTGDWQFRPNILFQYFSNNPSNLDLNAIFTYDKSFDVGLGYQFGSGISGIVGYEHRNLFIGYAYTYPIGSINRVAFQSHEIAIRLKFQNKKDGFQSPRFFN